LKSDLGHRLNLEENWNQLLFLSSGHLVRCIARQRKSHPRKKRFLGDFHGRVKSFVSDRIARECMSIISLIYVLCIFLFLLSIANPVGTLVNLHYYSMMCQDIVFLLSFDRFNLLQYRIIQPMWPFALIWLKERGVF